ncbi:bleomycin resistance protein [Nocardioides silvaticus]|uniref:Bleomycin resistance protein n=1 Tax=Nocardioides silvaticus TaxID=2201891 RepID=A0A316TG40_9ACTN|nr:VOC family protein [Nocardioides silvaticus]PWN02758.1 bleomycin resistance protein [Nocardioides silvaticus]
MRLGSAIPALPVRDVPRAVEHYRAKFGFEAVHQDDGLAVLVRDDLRLHLWYADDQGWQLRPVDDMLDSPVRTGAESFLAGTASCRISVEPREAIDEIYSDLAAAGVLHPTDAGAPRDTDFGTREFAALDLDGNLLEFYCWTGPG